MIKDYESFKEVCLEAQQRLKQDGKTVALVRWTKQSPFQKRRYTDESVYPEVWAHHNDMDVGVCINGEDITDSNDVIRIIHDAFYE